MRRHAGNASKSNSGDQGPRSGGTPEPRSHSTPQSEKDPSSALPQQELDYPEENSADEEDNDEASDIYGPCSLMNQSKQLPREQKTHPQATATPPFPTSRMTPLPRAKSTPTAVKPSTVRSRRVRKRSTKTNDEPIDITRKQMQVETALPSQGRFAELLFVIMETVLASFRNGFFVPLCFVLALLYLISSFRASLAEIVDTVQSAGIAIGSCLSFTWQYSDAWMRSAWNTAAPPLYEAVSTGVDVAIGAVNKTSVAVCSHYFGWLILTNLGLDCPFSMPYQWLDSDVDSALNNTALGLSEIADIAVEMLPYGRQLTYSELWLRQISFRILASDMIGKVELSTQYGHYTDQISAVGEELTAFVSGTDAHLDFQKYNLGYLKFEIQSDSERTWWHKLFSRRESSIRRDYLDYIHASDNALIQLYDHGSRCVELIRDCQLTNGKIQIGLQRVRDDVAKKVAERGILSRWLGRNEDLTRQADKIDNMEEYLTPVLDLLGSILDRVKRIRAELSSLDAALKEGHVGVTSARLMVQMQIISSSIERLRDARDDLRQADQKERARFRQQFKDGNLMFKPHRKTPME